MRLLNNTFEPLPQLLLIRFNLFVYNLQNAGTTILLLISTLFTGYAQDCLHDTIPPEIICKQNYIYRYGPCGNEQIYASEFVISAIDNCSKVKITFDREGKKWWDDSFILWMDPNWPNGQIKIYASDTSGNVSECMATYIAKPYEQTKFFTCRLITELDEEIDKIQLKVRTNDNTIYKANFIKNSNDIFDFYVTIEGDQSIQSLIVEPLDKPFVQEHITTKDQVLTLRQIVGFESYASPVNYISEDTDCNGEINLLDVYKSRKYVEGLISTDSCLGKPILYFIDEKGNILGQEIPYQGSPNRSPVIAFNQIGDMNSYLPNPGTALINPITKFSGEQLIWQATELSCVKGNQYAVDFTLNDSISLSGLQCNFALDSNFIHIDNFYTNFTYLNKNIYPTDIRLNWVNGFGPKFENGYPKATILFTAKSDFTLSDAFKPSEQSISNFAITSDGTVRPIVTSFSFVNAADHEDKDSPWIKVSTTSADPTIHIWGSIAQFDEAELFIHNIYGQTIYKQKIRTSDGQINEFIQDSNPGVYILDLKLPNRKQLTQAFVVFR